MRAVLVVALLGASSSFASSKVLVAPVQAGDVVPDDLAVELEESVRAGAMRQAPSLDLLVMSHATLQASLADIVKNRRDFAVTLPCKNAECDASLGRALGTTYAVSTRLTKLDGKYLALLRLLDAADGRVIASSSVEADSFGMVLSEAGNKVERMFSDGLAAKMIARPVVDRVLRAGDVLVAPSGGGFGLARSYRCELHTDRLDCRSQGLFSNGGSLVIKLAEVTSIFPDGDKIAIATSSSTERLSVVVEWITGKEPLYVQRAAERHNAEATETWRADIESAWHALGH